MSYTPEVAATLCGATIRQLAYWRSARTGPLLAPEVHEPRSTVLYSFRDVIALRTIVYLKASNNVSLQGIRKAVRTLRTLGESAHLSEYELVAVGKSVAWRISADNAVDLTDHPGQRIIATMVDILGSFRNESGDKVVNLFRPKPGVQISPEVRGGFPVVEGTRIPYDVVAGLLRDGMPLEDVRVFYPPVDKRSARGVVEFAEDVDERRGLKVAA